MSTDALRIRARGRWIELVDPVPPAGGVLEAGLGAPGLWRTVRQPDRSAAGTDGPFARVFEAPRPRPTVPARAGCASADEDVDVLHAWAHATRRGGSAPLGRPASNGHWSPPERDGLEERLAMHRLRLRSDGRVVRGELVHRPDRLALVFPCLVDVPDDLDPTRRHWVEHLLLEAQATWRLVRFGLGPAAAERPGSRPLGAEVDLTGVPHDAAPRLAQLALDALAWAVEWVLSPLFFLLETGSQSRALAEAPLN